ncbi:MAG: FAD-dependent oxidoreductase [Bacteroidota bacterium]
MSNEKRIHIIGAGVSGLVCAIELEKAGYQPHILEAKPQAGGRVQSDRVQGWPLDHGFQVLLTQYPMARQYLNYQALQLRNFRPGAVVFSGGKPHTIGDPLRDFGFLFSSLLSAVGSMGDKIKILRLSLSLKSKSLDDIFSAPERSTLEYLTDYGFSKRIIRFFFRPFFTGIFLEPNLATSSRMFEFVYKMFSEGHASVPANGIQAVTDQLQGQLTKTTFHFGAKVQSVSNGEILLADGCRLESDAIVLATDPAPFLPNHPKAEKRWHSCTTLYFKAKRSVLDSPIIGLIADEEALVNNLLYLSDLPLKGGDGIVLSATVVKPHQLDESALVARVKQDLQQYCGIEDLELIKVYPIRKALPVLTGLRHRLAAEDIQVAEGIFLAGDHLAYASLNAAMYSGQAAASLIAAS